MSIIRFEREFFDQIASDLKDKSLNTDYPVVELNEKENLLVQQLSEDPATFLKNKINTLIDRLSIANQVAFLYQNRPQKLEIESIDEFQDKPPRPDESLLNDLQSLQNNLSTDTGISFVSDNDLFSLDLIIDELHERIIALFDREQEEFEIQLAEFETQLETEEL